MFVIRRLTFSSSKAKVNSPEKPLSSTATNRDRRDYQANNQQNSGNRRRYSPPSSSRDRQRGKQLSFVRMKQNELR